MKLFETLTPAESHLITESQDNGHGGKTLFLQGLVIQGGVKNANERIYPVSEIRKAVDSINEKLTNSHDVLGELDHPETLSINLDKVCLKINKIWMDGNAGIARLQIIETPSGKIVRTLVEAGVRLGVSSRGVGNVDDHGNVSDYEIVTIDCVASPSCIAATPKPVFESFETKRGRVLMQLAEAIAHDPKAKRHFHKEMLAFINKLNS